MANQVKNNFRIHLSTLLLWLLALGASAVPVASFTVSSTSVCINQPVTITSTSTGSINSYTWNFGAGAVPSGATTIGPHNISYLTAGLKTITLTVSGPDGTATETRTDIIQVNAIPAAPGIITGPESVCSGATGVSFTTSPITFATSYSWSTPAGSTITSGDGTNQIQVSFGTLGGNICVNASNSCGTSANSCKTIALGKERIKLASYNILKYPDLANVSPDTTTRNPFFRTVVQALDPDILVTQENQSQAGVNGFLSNIMNKAIGGFTAGTFIDGFDTDNAIFFKNTKFSFVSNTRIRTTLRDINEFKLIHLLSGDTLRIFSVHLKASNTSADEAQRAQEVDTLRKYTNLLPTGCNFIVCGDFNIYRSSEPAYQKLLQITAGTEGHFIDPIPVSGIWNSSSFAAYHTQSPRVRSFGGGATGGLNDRFDLILYSTAISQAGGISFVPGSTVAFGNDGNHYNDSINQSPNTAVSQTVADALHYAADHLPVSIYLDFENTSCPFADVGATAVLDPGPTTCATPAQTVSVRVKNYGSNTLNFGNNNLVVNLTSTNSSGAIQQLQQIVSSGILSAGQETTISFTGKLILDSTGNYTLRAFTNLPGDTVNTNDSTAVSTIFVYPNADATVTITGSTTFCEGGSVALSVPSDSGTTFQWQNNSIDLVGSTNTSYTATASGSYAVVLQKSNTITTNFPATGFSNNTAYNIPNNSCTGATSSITVSGFNGTVNTSSISIKINIQHTAVGDLTIYLEAPNGQRLGLSNRTGNTGNTGDNFTNTVFSDNGSASLPTTGAPYTGTFKPWASIFSSCVSSTVTSFGALGNGILNPNGSWKLLVYDRASGNTGAILNWQIDFPAYTTSTSLVCQPLYSQPVTVQSVPPPPILLSPAAGSICSGGSVQLTASGAVNYVWSPSTGLSASTGSIVTVAPTVATTYTVTGTDANGCTGTTTVAVTLNTPPTVSLQPFNTICQNSPSFTLSGGTPTGGIYSGTGVTSGIFNPSAAGAGTHLITYSYTDANGCTGTAATSITVRPLPPATTTPSGNVAICQGSSLTINTSPGYTYSWSTGATTQSIDVSSPGNYSVTLTDITGCSAVSPALVITTSSFQASGVLFTETIGTVSTTTSIAAHEGANGFDNDQYTMSGTADVRSTTSSVGYNGSSGAANIFFTTITGRNFTISGINTSGLTNLQLSFGIYKNTNAATGADFSIQVSTDGINYTPLTFSALPTGTGTATWHSRSVTAGIPSTSNLHLQFLQNSTVTQYRIDDIRLSYSITSPSITSSGSTSVCQGDSVTLTASPSSGYEWDNGATSQSIVVTSSGNRFCTVTGSNGCVATTNSIVVTVNPELYAVTGGGSICAGDSGVAIGLNNSQAGVNYQLLLNGHPTGITIPGTGSPIGFSPQQSPGSYSVVGTHTASGCVADMTGTAIVLVSLPPIAYTVTGGGDYCQGTTGPTVGLDGSQSSFVYQLMRSGSPVVVSSVFGTGGAISFGNQGVAGNYYVNAIDNSSGCSTLMNGSASVVTLPSPAVFTITGGGGICVGGAGTSIGLSGSELAVNYSLHRNGVSVSTPLSGTGQAIDFGIQQQTGSYTVSATATNGCSASMNGTAVIQQLSSPLVYSVTGGGVLCELSTDGIPIGLTASEINVSYQLTRNGLPVAGGSQSGTGSTITFGDYLLAGTYQVTATKLSTGCTQTMSGSATVQVTSATRWFQDTDQDGYGDQTAVIIACDQPTGFTADSTDCSDNNSGSYPGNTEICGNGIDDNCNGQIDEACSILLQVTVLPEGYYRGSGRLAPVLHPLTDTLVCDTITISLATSGSPHAIVHSTKTILNTLGQATCWVPASFSGAVYYIIINHRSSLETWSSAAVALTSPTVQYDFSLSSTSAYGSNLKSTGDGKFVMYAGDVDQNDIINLVDLQLTENSTIQFITGYNATDVNGDGAVESSDACLLENNSFSGVTVIRP